MDSIYVLGVLLVALPVLSLWALLRGGRLWACPQCGEPGPFVGRCGICGGPNPGLARCVGCLVPVLILLAVSAAIWWVVVPWPEVPPGAPDDFRPPSTSDDAGSPRSTP